ncbi:unnamed protein product [Blepharisma stoltei]|uniref:Kelch motif family protein n=1 Tax=Blepharisma stoltei TaxID=1481888 RepID=A0AAU9I428_9CILI|nr:unnamed protein product [Blepharisma stoltei]CAG9310188.1 unnamed protein product [Blepharisma stoltei]
MAGDAILLTFLEEKKSSFNSISDIPLYVCTISTDSKEFLVCNIENNKICAKIQNPLPFNIITKGLICELNGSQLFYFGGCTKDDKPIGLCLLIDIRTQSVEVLPSGKPRYFANPVYFENFVYIFGGKSSNKSLADSDKFSLRKNKWKSIADLPCRAYQTSAIVYRNQILLSGRNLGNIWKYDPVTNSYESLFEIVKEQWKFFFIYKKQCYIVTSERLCFSSEVDDWKTWNYFGTVRSLKWPVSNVCLYQDNFIFFDQNSDICEFDIQKYAFVLRAKFSIDPQSNDNLNQTNESRNNKK